MRGALIDKTELQRLPFPANAILVKIKIDNLFKKINRVFIKIIESYIQLKKSQDENGLFIL